MMGQNSTRSTASSQGSWPQLSAQGDAYAQAHGTYYSVYHGRDGGTSPLKPITRRRVLVDNRDRQLPDTSDPFTFVVSLTDAGVERFENVVGVELKAVAFPTVADEMYVVMNVDELNDQLESTCAAAHRAYAVLYFDSDALATGSVKPIKAYDFYQKDAVFNPPLPVLDKLHVSFKKYDGSPVTTFDTAGNTHVSFILEVATPPMRY